MKVALDFAHGFSNPDPNAPNWGTVLRIDTNGTVEVSN